MTIHGMHILTIDDEAFVRLIVEEALREEGCEVESVGSGQQGLDRLRSASFDCVITDLRMPGLDGRAVLRWVKDHQPDVDVIVLTGHGEVKDAVAAIKDGAWDFLVKDTPFDGATVKAALAKLRAIRGLRRENLAARHGGYRQDTIVEGVSDAWRILDAQIAQVAPSQAPVLIQGETGSGKEVAARRNRSRPCRQPLHESALSRPHLDELGPAHASCQAREPKWVATRRRGCRKSRARLPDLGEPRPARFDRCLVEKSSR